MRISGVSLKDACNQTAGWEHKWSGYVAPNNGGQPHPQQYSTGLPDLPNSVIEEMRKHKENASRWQATADRLQLQIDSQNRGVGGGNGKGFGNGKDKRNKEPKGGKGDKKRERVDDRRDERRGDDRRGDRR